MSVESAKGFRAGQKKLSVGTLNAMLRAIRELQAGKGGAELKTVCCQNDTGEDLDAYQVVGIGGLNQTHADNAVNFLKSIVITGALPTNTYAGKFAVTQEPIKKGQTGRVKIAGVSQCKVNVTNAAHAYADASTAGGITQLTSAANPTKGCAEILWKESGTGSKWAVVRWPAFEDPATVTGLVGTPPIVTSEAGTTGTATTALKSDTKPGLKLRADGTPADISGLMFGSAASGLQVRIAGSTSEDDERAATAADPTLEVAPHPAAPGSKDGGLQVKVNATVSPSDLRTLEAQAGGLGVKISSDDANNIVAVNNGLTVSALASTTKRGLAPSATAPASGLRNVLAIDNGETAYKNAALFDANNPANLGTASPGTAMTAARRDHVHNTPTATSFTPVDGVSAGAFTSDGAWHDKDLSGSYGNAQAFLMEVTSAIVNSAIKSSSGASNAQTIVASGSVQQVVVPAVNGVFSYYQAAGGTLAMDIYGTWS